MYAYILSVVLCFIIVTLYYKLNVFFSAGYNALL